MSVNNVKLKVEASDFKFNKRCLKFDDIVLFSKINTPHKITSSIVLKNPEKY